MKTILATIGFIVVALYILSAIGVGNFLFIYSPHKILYTIIEKDAA